MELNEKDIEKAKAEIRKHIQRCTLGFTGYFDRKTIQALDIALTCLSEFKKLQAEVVEREV